MNRMSKPERRSWVYNHYRFQTDKAKCHFCDNVYLIKREIQDLKSHLINRHKREIYVNRKESSDIIALEDMAAQINYKAYVRKHSNVVHQNNSSNSENKENKE